MVRERNILDLAQPIGAMEMSKSLIATVYGPSGSGKTTFAASATSKDSYGLLIDMGEQGTASIIDKKYLDVIRIDDLQKLNKVILALKTDQKYKTVIFDSMQTLMGIVIQNVRNITEFAFVPSKSLNQKDWGQVSYYMCNFITEINNIAKEAGKNVIYICDEREKDAPDGDSIFVPNLMGSVERSLVGRSDCVVYTYIKRVQEGEGSAKTFKTLFCANIGPSSSLVAKVRKPKTINVDSVIVDPTWDKLTGIINRVVNGRIPVNP